MAYATDSGPRAGLAIPVVELAGVVGLVLVVGAIYLFAQFVVVRAAETLQSGRKSPLFRPPSHRLQAWGVALCAGLPAGIALGLLTDRHSLAWLVPMIVVVTSLFAIRRARRGDEGP